MDWEDARLFLTVAREGRLLGAAKRLGISDRRVRHVVDLALLPTPVQSAILTGEIEVSDRQAERGTKPLLWEEQAEALECTV